jgi:hypothetical protein
MNMKTILALIIGALVSPTAFADGANYVKLPEYNPNSYQAPAATPSDYGLAIDDDSYAEDAPLQNQNYNNDNYVQNPVDASSYSGNDNWGAVKAACDKREKDPYRISGQLSPLRIQIICTQYGSIQARIQAKGMNTYTLNAQPVPMNRWKRDVLCEDLVNSQYDINVLCGQAQGMDQGNYEMQNIEQEKGS